MSIRLRLTLWYTALLGATLIFFSVLVYSALATNLQAQIVQDSRSQAIAIARTISSQIESEIATMERGSQIRFPSMNFFISSLGVQLVGLDGTIIKQSSNLANVVVPGYRQAIPSIREGETYQYVSWPNGQPMLVYSAPFLVASQVAGAVQVVRPMGAVQDALSQVSRYLILGTGLSLVIAAVVGAFLARRELQPLAIITEAASSISETRDLDRRLNMRDLDPDSEIGTLADTFNEMLDRIQKLFQQQERLVADVSHELRTPLTTIQGNMELLQRMSSSLRATSKPAAGVVAAVGASTLGIQGAAMQDNETLDLFTEIVEEVESESTRMAKLINDLLLLAQADSGVLKLQLEPVEMDTILLDVYRQTRRMAEHSAGSGALEIRLGSEDQAMVMGDPLRLRQMLLNLTENAIKYTPAGGSITLSLENSGGWVQISVADTGIGIQAEQLPHIFDRFYRTDKARSRAEGGSGLGLSIVQWLAQAHNGTVTAQSTPGVGTTFTLRLPEYQSAYPLPDGDDSESTYP